MRLSHKTPTLLLLALLLAIPHGASANLAYWPKYFNYILQKITLEEVIGVCLDTLNVANVVLPFETSPGSSHGVSSFSEQAALEYQRFRAAFRRPQNSCGNRECSDITGPWAAAGCSCDTYCQRLGDCCWDYAATCRHVETLAVPVSVSDAGGEQSVSCVRRHAGDSHGILMVTGCHSPTAAEDAGDVIHSVTLDASAAVADTDGQIYVNTSVAADCHVRQPKAIDIKCLFEGDDCSRNLNIRHCDVPAEPQEITVEFLGRTRTLTYYPYTYTWNQFKVDVDRKVTSLQNRWMPVKNSLLAPSFASIPASFAVLMNFGLDGKEQVYLSGEISEQEDARCPATHVYDPFVDLCRPVLCNINGIINLHWQCLEVEQSNTSPQLPPPQDYPMKPVSNWMNRNSSSIKISLVLKLHISDSILQQLNNIMMDDIIAGLSSALQISRERLGNMTVEVFDPNSGEYECLNCIWNVDLHELVEQVLHDQNYTLIRVTFFIMEGVELGIPDEPTLDEVLAMMIMLVGINSFDFQIANVPVQVTALEENTYTQNIDLAEWCLEGEQVEYWNSDFSLVPINNETTGELIYLNVYVNSTGTLYRRGEYLANFMFQGSAELFTASVSGVIRVCEPHPYIAYPCLQLVEYNLTEFVVQRNRSLYHEQHDRLYHIHEYMMSPNNTESVLICSPFNMSANVAETPEVTFTFTPLQGYMSLVFISISLICMAATILTYTLFSKLRNLPGVNLLNFVISLFLAELIFLVGIDGDTSQSGISCKIVAVLLHYLFLCAFFWMNAMAYDLWKTFAHKCVLYKLREVKDYFPKYALYSYGCPLIITALSAAVDFWDDIPATMGYGVQGTCWITNADACFVAFGLPLAIILVANFCFFFRTIYCIRATMKISRRSNLTRYSGPAGGLTNPAALTGPWLATGRKKCASGLYDVGLYIKMSTLFGLTWVLGFLSGYSNNFRHEDWLWNVVNFLFLIFNTLQGAFIFAVFVCNKRVYALYKERLSPARCRRTSAVQSGAVPEGADGTSPRRADNAARKFQARRSESVQTVCSQVSLESESSGRRCSSRLYPVAEQQDTDDTGAGGTEEVANRWDRII